jgi:MFS family permease
VWFVSVLPLASAVDTGQGGAVTLTSTTAPTRAAWAVAAVSFLAILAAAGFRAVPGVLMTPLHHEFGWSHATVGLAMSVNMTLFGVTAPFAAALMDRFGVRPVLTVALGLITAGSALSVRMTTGWQLVACWGVLVGIGTGCISMGFVATVATRWFNAAAW